jgi:hypothetical protein
MDELPRRRRRAEIPALSPRPAGGGDVPLVLCTGAGLAVASSNGSPSASQVFARLLLPGGPALQFNDPDLGVDAVGDPT